MRFRGIILWLPAILTVADAAIAEQDCGCGDRAVATISGMIIAHRGMQEPGSREFEPGFGVRLSIGPEVASFLSMGLTLTGVVDAPPKISSGQVAFGGDLRVYHRGFLEDGSRFYLQGGGSVGALDYQYTGAAWGYSLDIAIGREVGISANRSAFFEIGMMLGEARRSVLCIPENPDCGGPDEFLIYRVLYGRRFMW